MKILLLVLVSILAACADNSVPSSLPSNNYFPVGKCGALLMVQSDYTIKMGLSIPTVHKACKNSEAWKGLYIVETNGPTQPVIQCGFWTTEGKLVTLDLKELTVDMNQYSVCD